MKGKNIMKKKFKVRRSRISKIAWGFFWLLLAGLILANLFGGFVELGVWSIIIGSIALIVFFHCIATLSFASLPIPIAALYYIFQAPIDSPYMPFVPFWTLALVTVLVTIGLHIMLPRRFGSTNGIFHVDFGNSSKHKYDDGSKNGFEFSMDDGDAEVIIDGDVVVNGIKEGETVTNKRTKIEEGDDTNNPYISVSFGYASRYLHAESLETAELSCNFGGMEVYFDNVTLSPDGAEVNVNCNFGSMEIYVPSNWRVIDDVNASLANSEVSRKLQSNTPDAPTMRVTGSVSLGNLEIKRIKGD